MRRHTITPRYDWREKVEELGLIWHTADDQPYWNESAYYEFSIFEINEIERATTQMYQLLLEAGDYVLNNGLLTQFGIPSFCHDAIRSSWNEEPAALNYGRFDFGYDGTSPPKLFEFNCDTPTSLLEAAVVQWYWKEETFPTFDQYNSLHESLIARWQEISPRLNDGIVHFTHVNDYAGEDTVTTNYMRDLAEEAGVSTDAILIQDIGWDGSRFLDLNCQPITNIQHLYPWEWLVNEEFGQHVIESLDETLWIEPIWKMIWSNKAILSILTKIAPNHPNLLKSYLTKDELSRQSFNTSFVKKPILAREGANVEIHDGDTLVAKRPGDYGDEGYVYQELYKLPNFDGSYPVIGAWIVDGAPVGMGIREDGLITGNTARFVPHVIT